METIKIEIDHSNKDYKILKITALTNDLKSNDFQIFLNMWQNFLDNSKKNNSKFAMIWNLDEMRTMNIVDLEKIAKLYLHNRLIIGDLLICSCIFVDSTFFDSFFGFFKKIYQPTKPVKKCLENEDSLKFINDCFNNKYDNKSILY